MRPVPVNDDVPWTPPTVPVSAGTLALVTTAGLHHRDDAPFVKYDQTYRVIDAGVAEQDLLQSQSSIGFDRSLRMRDINVVFPIDRLRELVAEHEIGALGPKFYGLVGAQDNSEQTAQTIGSQIGPLLLGQGVRFVLITPTCPFCTHTASALARVLEAQGLSTVVLALVREFVVKVRPPRAVFVPFPFGAPVGLPGERDQQLSVLRIALATFGAEAGPVLADFDAGAPAGYVSAPVQASEVSRPAEPAMDTATEASMMRRYYEQWLEQRGGKTAVGLSRVPVTRFRGIIRFFESFLADPDADARERPAEMPRAEFMRYCSDDLKAMYLEGRIVMKPGETPDQALRWLWGETALGALLVAVKEQMAESPDPDIHDAGFGIARLTRSPGPMLFHVRMTVALPDDLDYLTRAELLTEEERYCRQLQEAGTWLHLWRVAGHYASIAIFDVESADTLHAIFWNHPLLTFLKLDIAPLTSYPSAVVAGEKSLSVRASVKDSER
jgi:D-proline reductase (dithiol) PrdB